MLPFPGPGRGTPRSPQAVRPGRRRTGRLPRSVLLPPRICAAVSSSGPPRVPRHFSGRAEPWWEPERYRSFVTDMSWLDATAQADLVRRGEASPAELVDAAI